MSQSTNMGCRLALLGALRSVHIHSLEAGRNGPIPVGKGDWDCCVVQCLSVPLPLVLAMLGAGCRVPLEVFVKAYITVAITTMPHALEQGPD